MNGRKDLVVLVADKSMGFAVKGVLGRSNSIGCRAVDFDLYVHPERDPGCLNRGPDFLRSFTQTYDCSLILFDHLGCGRDHDSADLLEKEVEEALSRRGWRNSAAIVISPELENWVWADSPHVDTALGWEKRHPALRPWLKKRGFWPESNAKPLRPKEALEAALREARKSYSSSLFLELANNVSLDRCSDRAFGKLKKVIKSWFPEVPKKR